MSLGCVSKTVPMVTTARHVNAHIVPSSSHSAEVGAKQLTFGSWYSQGVTSDEGCGVRGRELVGDAGLEWWLPIVLFRELPRFLDLVDCASMAYGVLRLVSEFWRPSCGKSSPKKFGSLLWKPLLDLDPVLLTVVALATDGRLSSLRGKPMLSSRLPVPGRAKPGDNWARSSLESL
jgi:hypothetical protein